MSKIWKNINFYLAVFIAVILAIALIFAVSSQNTVKVLESGTPEASVQQYLQAVNDGRNEEAANYFSSAIKCTVDDIDRAYVDNNAQITLDKTVLNNENSAVVYISIERSSGPLKTDPFIEAQTFRLNRENGVWKISGIPWPLYDCGGETK